MWAISSNGLGAHHIYLRIYGVWLGNHAVDQASLDIGLKNGAVYLLFESLAG